MSTWEKIEDKDIELSYDEQEVEIHVGTAYDGNHYLTLTFKQIEEIYKKINQQTVTG